MRVVFVIAFVFVAVCVPGLLAAEEGTKLDARTEFNRGIDLFAEQKYEAAVASFRKAYELKPTWKLLYNIGQCEAALKRFGLSIDAFEQYLAQGGDDIPSDKLDYVLDELDKMRRMVGNVKISAPDGMEIWIDQIHRGTTPTNTPITVTAGISHEIVLKQDGKDVHVTNEKVRGGSVVEVEFGMKDEETPKETASIEDDALAETEDDGISPAFFWTGLVTTVVAGGATVAMVLAVNSQKDNLGSQGDLDSAESMQSAGIALLCVTGAAAITTTVLAFFTDFNKGDEKEDGADLSVGFFHHEGANGLTIGGKF
jgi:hypothetical protein